MGTIFTTNGAILMLEALRNGQISTIELLRYRLGQVEQLNPALNAIVIPNDEEAIACAQINDQARTRGDDCSLPGLPFTVKGWIKAVGLYSLMDKMVEKKDGK